MKYVLHLEPALVNESNPQRSINKKRLLAPGDTLPSYGKFCRDIYDYLIEMGVDINDRASVSLGMWQGISPGATACISP
jgi:hypothetical protein